MLGWWLNKLVREANSVVGLELDSLESVAERRMKDEIKAILNNLSHPLHDELWQIGSSFSHRIIPPRCNVLQYLFVGTAAVETSYWPVQPPLPKFIQITHIPNYHRVRDIHTTLPSLLSICQFALNLHAIIVSLTALVYTFSFFCHFFLIYHFLKVSLLSCTYSVLVLLLLPSVPSEGINKGLSSVIAEKVSNCAWK